MGLSSYEREAVERTTAATYMKHITELHLAGMLSELKKEAGVASDIASRGLQMLRKVPTLPLVSRIPGINSRVGQTLAGGALGGAIGAATGEEGDRLHRGVMGGLLGASAVGLGHMATQSGRDAAKKSMGNLWQRSKYQFTGKGLEGTPEARILKAREIGLIPEAGKNKAVDAAQEHALKNDWLSLPGAVHGLVTQPGQVLKNSWNRMDTMGKGLTAAGGAITAADMIQKPTPEGPGRLEKGLGGLASTIGFTAGPAGILPGMLMGSWAGKAGQRVGRVGDRLLGYNPAAEAAPMYEGAVQ